MRYTIHFIACHRVSPQEKRRRTEKWKMQRQKQGKAPNPRSKRGHRHTNGKPHARKNGRTGKGNGRKQ